MVKIQRLARPNKRSGYALGPGKTTSVRGVVIVNKNDFTIHVDKFTRKYSKKKK